MQILKKITLILLFISPIILYHSCTKITTTTIGGNLLNQIDGISTFDTVLDVITQTIEDPDTTYIFVYNKTDSNDVLFVRLLSSDKMVIGTLNDPQFGSTNANLWFEMRPVSFPFYISSAPDSLVIDSVVLSLSVSSVYGDQDLPMSFKVYEANPNNSSINVNKAYPSNYPELSNFVKGDLLGSLTNFSLPKIQDSFIDRFDKDKNVLRIKLDISLAKKLLQLYDTNNVYKNISNFRNTIKGFQIETSNGNALVNINLINADTRLDFYYNTNTVGTTPRDTLKSTFVFWGDNSIGAVNYIKNSRAGSELANHLNVKNDSVVYLQSSPGTIINISIPGLKNFPKKVIHLAEIQAYQLPDPINYSTLYQKITAPRFSLLYVYDSFSNLNRYIPKDFILSDTVDLSLRKSNVNGFLQLLSYNNYEKLPSYNFNISRYVQNIINKQDSIYNFKIKAPGNFPIYYKYGIGSPNYITHIKPTFSNTHGNGRIRLGGGSSKTPYKMKFRMIYSNIN